MEVKTSFVPVDGLKIAMQTYAPPGPGPHPVLCVCHGLPPGPRDPSDRGYQDFAGQLCAQGFLTIIFNFRGVGDSEGNVDMPGWCRDLSGVLDHAMALPQADPRRINLLGFSAGAAAAIFVAAHDERVTAVASCAAPARFSFLPTIETAEKFLAHLRGAGMVRDPGFPPSVEEWLAGFRAVSPLDWVGRISPRPLLILHGESDELVPVKSAHLLHDRAGEPRDLCIIPGAGHRLRRDPRAVDAAVAWLKRVNRL